LEATGTLKLAEKVKKYVMVANIKPTIKTETIGSSFMMLPLVLAKFVSMQCEYMVPALHKTLSFACPAQTRKLPKATAR
jgi:hypothetical protein